MGLMAIVLNSRSRFRPSLGCVQVPRGAPDQKTLGPLGQVKIKNTSLSSKFFLQQTRQSEQYLRIDDWDSRLKYLTDFLVKVDETS